MVGSKDDDRVIKFMTLFARLREWSDNDPASLNGLAAKDGSIKDLSMQLYEVADEISQAEGAKRPLFTAPVDPKFIKEWREFDKLYSSVLRGIWWEESLGMEVGSMPVTMNTQSKEEAERRFHAAKIEACDAAKQIEMVFDYAERNLKLNSWTLSASFVDDIECGISAWRRLLGEGPVDVEGIIRRRKMVPFVMIPRQVARHHGDVEKPSLPTLLQQAQEALIYGCHFASISLLRSILETVLKIHYGASGTNLEEYIRSVAKFPSGVSRHTLHELRQLANNILHCNQNIAATPRELEPKIFVYLYTLRYLIEGAPP